MTNYRWYGEQNGRDTQQGCGRTEERRGEGKCRCCQGVYALARDPDVQARIKKLADDGKKIYGAATSPEAKRAYRQAADIIKKVVNK